jgi:hypothetical protein
MSPLIIPLISTGISLLREYIYIDFLRGSGSGMGSTQPREYS